MSLKFFHQVIIFAGIAISLIFAWFCFFDSSTAGSTLFKVAGVGSVLAAFGLVAYEIHFLKRTKRLIIH
jgi:high-affinity Fe2+/Pb2+ permease